MNGRECAEVVPKVGVFAVSRGVRPRQGRRRLGLGGREVRTFVDLLGGGASRRPGISRFDVKSEPSCASFVVCNNSTTSRKSLCMTEGGAFLMKRRLIAGILSAAVLSITAAPG